MAKPRTQPLPVYDISACATRAALRTGLLFWSRATGSAVTDVMADELVAQQMSALRRATSSRAPVKRSPQELEAEPQPPLRYWWQDQE